ncbi:MAG: electron transfer flavoprotein subunit beta/FixA family protein [Chloroflexi bacterium]|nr:electron transfer flavoprotein subunit beta/FixA family protein [Chloroflexota bacterium]
MKFIVCVKLTPDTEQLAEVRAEDVGSDDLGVTMVLNPWDEFAVEEALQLQERFEGETAVVTLGSADATEALKRAVAMGIEEAFLLSDPAFDGSDAWGTTHVLAQAIRKIGDYSLILTGRQSVDGNSGLIGPGLATSLGVPFVAQVAKIVDLTEETVTVKRSLDEGMQTVRVKLPAVLSVSKEINEPRYPNFMGIRKASKMQYPVIKAKDLPGLNKAQIGEGAALVKWTSLRKPPARTGKCEFIAGATVADQAAALADKLIAEKVI